MTGGLPPQEHTCDGFLVPPGASVVRVLAAQDDTSVSVEAPPGVPAPAPATFRLMRGEVRQMVAAGGSLRVTSTRPVLVTEGMDCEASLSSAIATAELLTDLRFAVLPHFDQMIAVVRPARAEVFLGESRIDDLLFAPAGGGFQVAHITLPACPSAAGGCVHHLSGRFGMSLRGMDVLSSYAMTAPSWVCDAATGCVD